MIVTTCHRLAVPTMRVSVNLNIVRKFSASYLDCQKCIAPMSKQFFDVNSKYREAPFWKNFHRNISSGKMTGAIEGIQDNISALQMKKRPVRKKRSIAEDEETPVPGYWNVKALATAEEYDLEGLTDGLLKQNLYTPNPICTSNKCE